MQVEKLNYRPGGFHPVHLNDTFNSSRYTVLHKLGHGGFATVWLARDSVRQRYVALKILAAKLSKNSPEVETLRRLRNWRAEQTQAGQDVEKLEDEQEDVEMTDVESEGRDATEKRKQSTGKEKQMEGDLFGKQYVMSMLAHFWIDGPNGRHLCVVSEVGGPSIKQFNDCPGLHTGSRRLRGDVGRKVALQATEGLAFIHSTGTVHGDLTAANILLKLANIDEWTVEEVYKRLGSPETQKLHRMAGTTGTGSEPRYTVKAIDMKMVAPKWLSDRIMIIDFGIAFLTESPSSTIGTPKQYCAPELEFKELRYRRSVRSDIWALGCTIFEIRTGSSLFRYGGAPSRDQLLVSMVRTLGTLPPEWWACWEKGVHWYELENMSGGQLAAIPGGMLHNLIMETGAHDGDAKIQRVKPHAPGITLDRADSSDKKKSLSDEKAQSSTNRLVSLVEELSTSEAAEVMALLGDRLGSGSGSGSSGGRSSDKSGSRLFGSGSGGSGSSNAKSGEKSLSSEGISTTVTQDIELSDPADFLEAAGTIISMDEADDLENLLRGALAYHPEERKSASLLAKHRWFITTYRVTK